MLEINTFSNESQSSEVKQLVARMTFRRGSSARCSRSSSSSVAGSNKASRRPSKQVSQPVQATPENFVPQRGTANHLSGTEKPDSMAAPMNPPSILQYGNISAESAPLLYSPQAGTGYNTMTLEQQSFAAGGAILNGTAYNFNQPLQSYAESAW